MATKDLLDIKFFEKTDGCRFQLNSSTNFETRWTRLDGRVAERNLALSMCGEEKWGILMGHAI